MRTSIYGAAGIVTACLIFAVVILPGPEVVKFFSTDASPEIPAIPIVENASIAVDLIVSNFTEPVGPGSEAYVAFRVMSREAMSNVTLQITVSPLYVGQGEWPNITWTPVGPQGLDIVGGDSARVVNLSANTTADINVTIRAARVGFAVITATATWRDASAFHKNESALHIQVMENGIYIYDDSEGIQMP